MDVTPSPKMYAAMQMLTDALCGDEPSKLLVGPGAQAVRAKRELCMTTLHKLVALSMREGVNRAVKEARDRRDMILDREDRRAAAQARDDAQRDTNLVRNPGAH